jgi:hypothetical protein
MALGVTDLLFAAQLCWRHSATALSNWCQSITNWVCGRLRMQKRKLENFELRLADEIRAFRPENGNA